MKQPLYAILIAPIPAMREAILNGVKKITIREGHRDYRNGKVVLCCHLEPWAVMAEIIDVRHTTLKEITEEEYKADGFKSQDDMLNGMRRFYPEMTMDSPVTVIRWENVQGKLYDEALQLKKMREHYPQFCICADYENGLVAGDCHVHNENPKHFIGDEEFECDCYSL